jgi:aspartyl-tRNA(Asn)/glutamyl-tRNA(Gln) amidotransferase subunit B
MSRIRGEMPELPAARRQRFIEHHGLTEYNAGVLTATKATGDYFEVVATVSGDARAAANWVMGDLAALLKEQGEETVAAPVSAENLGGLIKLIAQGTISGKIAKEILPKMLSSGDTAETIVEREGLHQISDSGALEKIEDDVIAANPKQVEQYRGGKQAVIGFLVGQVMKASRGQADPAAVNALLKGKL